MDKLFYILLVACMLFLISCSGEDYTVLNPSRGIDQSAGIQQYPAIVRGKLTLNGGTPLKNIQVVAEGDFGGYTAISDDAGNYAMNILVPLEADKSKLFKIYVEYYDNKIYCYNSCNAVPLVKGDNNLNYNINVTP